MNKKQSQSRKKLHNRRVVFMIILLVTVLVGVIAGLYVVLTDKNIDLLGTSKNKSTSGYYTPGTGGDISVFNKSYDGAVAAWKQGDKDKAKELAQIGLDENEKLSVKQQEEIDDQIEKIRILYDLTKGRYFEE